MYAVLTSWTSSFQPELYSAALVVAAAAGADDVLVDDEDDADEAAETGADDEGRTAASTLMTEVVALWGVDEHVARFFRGAFDLLPFSFFASSA